jgi:O-antigen ligase
VRGLALDRRFADLSLSTSVQLIALFAAAPLVGWAIADRRWVVVGAVFAVAVTPLLLRWPVVSTIGLYAMLVPFEDILVIGRGATAVRLVGMLAAAVLIIVGLKERRLVHPPVVAVWWTGLILWGALTAVWAIDPDTVMDRLPTAISLLSLYLVAVSFRVTPAELRAVCILAVVGGVATALFGLIFGVGDLETGRRGTLAAGVNPNGFASSLLPAAALAAGAVLKLRGIVARGAALTAIAILAAGVYVSVSRAAILALAVIIGVLVYRLGIRSQLLLMALVLVGLLGMMPDQFFNRVTGPLTGTDATGSGRTDIWTIGLGALHEFWLWGAGLSNFPEAYGLHAAVPPQAAARGAHNLYLGMWVELGIIGFVIMLVAIVTQLRVAWRGRDSGNMMLYAAEAAFLGVLTISFFGDTLWSKRFWMLCIMIVWAVRMPRESHAESVAEAGGSAQPVAASTR